MAATSTPTAAKAPPTSLERNRVAKSGAASTTGTDRWAAGSFRDAGWRVHPLDGYWQLASEPHATTGEC